MLSGAQEPEWRTAGFQQGVIAIILECTSITVPENLVSVEPADRGKLAAMLAGNLEPDPQNLPEFVVKVSSATHADRIYAVLQKALGDYGVNVQLEVDEVHVIGPFANLKKALLR